MAPPRQSIVERFLAQAGPPPADPDDCWLWQGRMHEFGYGRFYMLWRERKTQLNAHRAAYLLFVSEDIDGLHIDHLCRNRRCVNPFHLEAVTQRENIMRGEGAAAKAGRWTHCPRGHEFTPENTMRQSSGARLCATCERARWARNNARRRAA